MGVSKLSAKVFFLKVNYYFNLSSKKKEKKNVNGNAVLNKLLYVLCICESTQAFKLSLKPIVQKSQNER